MIGHCARRACRAPEMIARALAVPHFSAPSFCPPIVRFRWNLFDFRGLPEGGRHCAVGWAAMSIGLDHFDMSRWTRMGVGFPVRSERAAVRWGGPLSFVLPVVLVIGAAGTWLVLPAFDSDGAVGDPAADEPTATIRSSAAPDEADTVQSGPPAQTGQQPAGLSDPPPTARLRISGQSWQRAGLGSNAQATFTLRNDNSYPVKDIEVACAFARRDGTHLTDRKRIIPVTVEAKAKKRFARLHVGFVNVHAHRINCSVIAANRV